MVCNPRPSYSHCTVFTTALCNLRCRYCYICKDVNGALAQIDKEIAECIENHTFIKQLIDFEPTIVDTLQEITLWGGEPTLHLERFTNVFETWAETFPNFSFIDISSNFTVDDMVDKFEALLRKIEKVYMADKNRPRPFKIDLQLSIDGYPEMNDFGRGAGSTDKILKNLERLCQVHYNKDIIYLRVFTKPTLSKETFHFLDTEEKCEKWFTFFQTEMYNLVHKYSNPFANFECCLFNQAAPSEWTEEDGKYFAKIIQNIINITPKIKHNCKDWSSHKTLNPVLGKILSCNDHIMDISDFNKVISKPRCGGGCGVFSFSVTPIPHNKFTLCHRGLFEAYTDYCNAVSEKDNINGLASQFFKIKNTVNANGSIFTGEELKAYKKMFDKLYMYSHKIFPTDLLIFIREYARAGIINEQFLNPSEVMPTLGYFLNSSYCVADAYIFTGSWLTHETLEVPLLYNGAMEATLQELKNILEEKGEL